MPRLTGKNAALYISTNNGSTWGWVGDLYEWVLEFRTITFPTSIKGSAFDRRTPSHLEGRLNARRYVQATSVLAASVVGASPSTDAGTHNFVPGIRLQWAVVAVDPGFPTGGNPGTFTTNTTVKAQGTGYVDRGHIGAPRTQIEDDFELQADTLVTFQ